MTLQGRAHLATDTSPILIVDDEVAITETLAEFITAPPTDDLSFEIEQGKSVCASSGLIVLSSTR